MPGYDDDLRLAHVLANAVERVTMTRFKAEDLHVDTKPDATWVSDADRTAEQVIRTQLGRTRPRDAVHGEEMPDTGYGPRRWVIDPIDGTNNFVRGVPVWATLIALMDGPEAVMGLVAATATDRLDAMLGVMDACWRNRAYGDFWSYMLLAEGAVDIAAEPELALHDMAALVPIVTEAGGRFTSLDGRPGPFGGSALATNGLLHDEVLHALTPELRAP